MEDDRSVCPIPLVGYCIQERCNFWDETVRQCTGDCLGDYEPLEDVRQGSADTPCTIYWTEDTD